MKRCSRKNGFVLIINIAGSESFECKTRRKILPKAWSSVKKCHFEQRSHLRVLGMEEKSTCFEARLQYKFKTIFAPIVETCGSSHFGALVHDIRFCFSASAAGASEENLSDFFTVLENAMKSASKEMLLNFLLKQSMTDYGAFRKKSF